MFARLPAPTSRRPSTPPTTHVVAGLVVLALGLAPARAQEVVPRDDLAEAGPGARGWVRAEARGPVGAARARSPQGGGGGQAHLDLGREVHLDLAYARGAGGRELIYAELGWRDLRIGAGVVGRDGGAHVGYRPRLDLDLARWLRLDLGLDLALGVGVLDDRGDAAPRGPAGRPRRALWRAGARTGVDVWSASLAGDVALTASPWRPLELTVGARTAAFAAVAEPRGGDALPGLDLGPARETDPGVATTLSEGEVGVFAEARLELARGADVDGRALALTLAYREAWDWLHRDLAYTAAATGDPWSDVRLAPVPWRSARALELALERSWGEDGWLSVSVDARHVLGSTTSEGLDDRDGVSFGLRVAGRLGRVQGAVSARHHLRGSRLEPLLGPMPETAVTATLGVVVLDRRDLTVSVEAGVDVGRQDDWGLPRRGEAVSGALTIAFGGARADVALRAHALALPPPPRRLAPRLAAASPGGFHGLGGRSLDDLRQAAADLDPEDRAHIDGVLDRSGVLDGDVTAEDVQRLLDDPTLVARAEQLAPGITAAVEQVLAAARPGVLPLDVPGSLLFVGYGLDRADLGLTWTRGPTLSRAIDFEPQGAPVAPVAPGVDPRLDPYVPALRATGDRAAPGGLGLHGGGLLELARARGWQKLTVSRRRGAGDHELLFQGATGWTRGVRLVLSGR